MKLGNNVSVMLCLSLLFAGCNGELQTAEARYQGDVPADAGIPDALSADAMVGGGPMNVGLGDSGVPPLGEGVAPLDGVGGDGSPSVPGKGPAEGAPGAIRWYGGQWLIPYQGRPGSTIQNVSCDVIPNASSTDLIELIGSAGVIGSVTVPAATGMTIRAWITTPHLIADGEVLVMRHSPRDSTTGAWTTGTQQLTILGCAVNTITPHVLAIQLAPTGPATALSGTMIAGAIPTQSGQLNATFIAGFALPQGSHIVGIRAGVQDNSGCRMAATLGHAGASGAGFWNLGTASDGSGNTQTISSPTLDVVVSTSEAYYAALRSVAGTSSCLVIWAEASYW